MALILKPVFDILTGDVVVCGNILYNYLILLIVGEIAFRCAYCFVGDAYRFGIINGRAAGSILHWIIRLLIYLGVAYLLRIGIWVYHFVIHVPLRRWLVIGAVCCLLTATVYYIVVRKQKKKNCRGELMSSTPEYVFEKLTPVGDTDIKVYQSAIDFAFQEADVKNVAISGAYGAGKSSVLYTYEQAHEDKKFVHISLAHFQGIDPSITQPQGKQERKDSAASHDIETVLEGKIINQLIHQIPADSIPQTNFKVKKSIAQQSIWISSIAIILLLLSFLHITHFDEWSAYISLLPDGFFKTVFSLSTATIAPVISGSIGITVLFLFVRYIIKAQKNKNIFKKLNIQGNEIEILGDNEDSYFDKYLNEVLYLFENIDADVIVFEDMDRFDVTRIFERLREINTLANISRVKAGKTTLRFFYLLRDDIFTSKDRTKFFDYIIPVVPVLDSSNSFNQFINHLKKNCIFEKFDEHFLQGVSLYVDDMRLLKNICNEFLIYLNRLNITELDYNKMLAIIIYKNLFPRDFSHLQLNRGFVFALFDSKHKFTSARKEMLCALLDTKKEEIEYLKKETLESIQELDDSYRGRQSRIYPYYGVQRQKEEKELQKWYESEYPKRKAAIESRNAGRLQKLESEQQAIEHEIAILAALPLCQIITRDNIDEIFRISTVNEIGKEEQYLEIKGSSYFDLLKYLIREGYIDESYADYMTYFYENSLSREDKVFLRSVTDKKAKDYGFELKHPEMVFDKLRPIDFDQEETLNFALVDYMLKCHRESDKLKHLIGQLQKSKNYAFIEQFFDYTDNKYEYISVLNGQWVDFLSTVIKHQLLSTEHIKQFVVCTLYSSNQSILDAINIDREITAYISESEGFLNISQPDIPRLIEAFSALAVSFRALDYDASDKELFAQVYKAGLYDLNFNNIRLMLRCAHNFECEDDIYHCSYSLIRKNIYSSLYKKISANMQGYMEILLTNCSGLIKDAEHVALEILNHQDVTQEQKEQYIDYLNTPLTELKAVKDKQIWDHMLIRSAVSCTAENILVYFLQTGEINEVLVNFINCGQVELDFTCTPVQFSEEERENLFDATIPCNTIDTARYTQIVSGLNFTYEAFDISGIQPDKIKVLIEMDIISMNSETLTFIRKNYPGVIYQFIAAHIDEYCNLMTEELFSHSELLELLAWDIDDSLKLHLLRFEDTSISIVDKSYSLAICIHILRNNLDADDMRTLWNRYSKQPSEIQKIVLGYAISHMTQIIAQAINVDIALIDELLSAPEIVADQKIALLIAVIPVISRDTLNKYLRLLQLNEFEKIFAPYSRPKIEVTPMNDQLLSNFRNRGWLYDYEEDAEKNGYYKIQKTSPQRSTKRK